MLSSLQLNEKSREVCFKTKSPPALLAIIGQVAENITTKWPSSQEVAVQSSLIASIITFSTLVTLLLFMLPNGISHFQ